MDGGEIMRAGRLDSRTVSLPKKEKVITILNSEHNIFPEYPTVWTSISGEDDVMFEIVTNLLNHFAFEFNGNSLVVWANSVFRITHSNLDFPELSRIKLNRNFYGVVSLYHRELKKIEIIEHYLKYHVKAFTYDEVLNEKISIYIMGKKVSAPPVEYLYPTLTTVNSPTESDQNCRLK